MSRNAQNTSASVVGFFETNALDEEYRIDQLGHLANSKANALLVVVPASQDDTIQTHATARSGKVYALLG